MSRSDPARVSSVLDAGALELDPSRARLLLALWRALAAGRPLGEAEIAAAARRCGAGADEAGALLGAVGERGPDGRLVGVLGLSLARHPHRFTVRGVALFTWCAVDALFLPAMLGAPATVDSVSPVDRRAIRVEVSERGVGPATPPGTVVTLPALEMAAVDVTSAAAIRAGFCRHIRFLASAAEAGRWDAAPPDLAVLDLRGAWRHALERWGRILEWAGEERPGAASTGGRPAAGGGT